MVKRNCDSELDIALWRRITENCETASTSTAQPPPSETAQDKPSASGLSLATLITKGASAALHHLTRTLRSSNNKGWHGRLNVLRDL